MATVMRVQAQALQRDDIVASGETVLKVAAGLYTPRGKVEVILVGKDGKSRMAKWGKYTMIGVRRG